MTDEDLRIRYIQLKQTLNIPGMPRAANRINITGLDRAGNDQAKSARQTPHGYEIEVSVGPFMGFYEIMSENINHVCRWHQNDKKRIFAQVQQNSAPSMETNPQLAPAMEHDPISERSQLQAAKDRSHAKTAVKNQTKPIDEQV